MGKHLFQRLGCWVARSQFVMRDVQAWKYGGSTPLRMSLSLRARAGSTSFLWRSADLIDRGLEFWASRHRVK